MGALALVRNRNTIVLNSNSFVKNLVRDVSGFGGAIDINRAKASLKGVNYFHLNKANQGAGLSARGSRSSVVLEGGIFYQNKGIEAMSTGEE